MAFVAMHRCDDAGRPRSEIFVELPSKAELPAYYEIIKKVSTYRSVFPSVALWWSLSSPTGAFLQALFSSPRWIGCCLTHAAHRHADHSASDH